MADGLMRSDVDWKDRHPRLCEMFEAAEDASRTNREKAERDIDYYDGKQFTEEEVRELAKRGQPAIVKNRIRRKIKFLQGLEKQQRTEPRAVPRTPRHEEDAGSATAALRFVTDQNRYDQTRSKAFRDLATAGWGGVEVTVEQRADNPNPRVVLRRCQWDRMFADPYSSEEDYSDANYLGMVTWMDRTKAVKDYGAEAGQVFDETVTDAGGTYDDKPKLTTWVSTAKRPRIRVVQIYYRDDQGVWNFAEFTKGGILKAGVSPWVGEDGQPEHAYEWASANIDRDNNRYGEIRELIDVQDSINKRETKMLHQVSVRQTFGTAEAMGGKTVGQLRRELARPDGHIELPPGAEWMKDFGIVPTADMANGQFQLLQEAKQEMDLMGPNAAMQGKGPEDQSGRAILAQQQGGAIEIGTLTDSLRDMDHRVYRKVWRRIRQFWTAEEWVSVTDEEKNLKWVGLNLPQMQQVMDPMSGQVIEVPAVDPETGEPALQNAVSMIDVDFTIDDAPDMGTMHGEQLEQLVKLVPYSPELQQLPAAFWIKASELRNKTELLQAIEDAKTQAAPPPDPMQEQAKQVALQGEAAKVEKTQSETAKNMAAVEKTYLDAMRPAPQPQQMNGYH